MRLTSALRLTSGVCHSPADFLTHPCTRWCMNISGEWQKPIDIGNCIFPCPKISGDKKSQRSLNNIDNSQDFIRICEEPFISSWKIYPELSKPGNRKHFVESLLHFTSSNLQWYSRRHVSGVSFCCRVWVCFQHLQPPWWISGNNRFGRWEALYWSPAEHLSM